METGSRHLPLRIANLVAFLATVTVNALANTLPIAGRNTGELSDLYPNLFVPSGLTFAIWGLIYLLLAIYSVYQLVVSRPFVERIGPLFVISSAANIAWIFTWHYELVPVSLACMLVLLSSLLAAYRRLFVGRSAGSMQEKYLVHVAFSVYLGWITVATIANVTALLVKLGWGRFGLTESLWAAFVIGVATVIVLLVLVRRADIPYALVALWAFAGIIIKRASAPVPQNAVLIAAAVGTGLILLLGLVQLRRWLRY
jgi:hypothetical protein